MRLKNETKYRNDDLKKFIVAGLDAEHTKHPRVVTISYCRGVGITGYAHFDGSKMCLRLEFNPDDLNLVTLGRILAHEAGHLRGIRHADMSKELLYSHTSGYPVPWVAGLSIRVKEVQVKQKPVVDKVARREAKVRAQLLDLETTIKRLQSKYRKLREKVLYYDRKNRSKTIPAA